MPTAQDAIDAVHDAILQVATEGLDHLPDDSPLPHDRLEMMRALAAAAEDPDALLAHLAAGDPGDEDDAPADPSAYGRALIDDKAPATEGA